MGLGTLKNGLGEALFVPQASRNLLSVSKLCSGGRTVTFSLDNVFLDSEVIGRLTNRLYTYHPSSTQSTDEDEIHGVFDFANDLFTAESSPPMHLDLQRDFDLIHRRFGHVDVAILRRMVSRNSVDGMTVSAHAADPNRFHCADCAITKAQKLSRIPSLGQRRNLGAVNKSLFFNVVWSDVLGPITPTALGGYVCGVTFTEQNSKFRWFYPLREKSDVISAFSRLVADVSSWGFTVRLLRSDNGGEYTSKEFADFCISHNIEHRHSPPYTPAANSVSERFNRILGERARAMLRGSSLPRFLWAEAMSTATYIYNRTISPMSDIHTPYELLFGVRPDVSNLRAYGCVCYVYNFPLIARS